MPAHLERAQLLFEQRRLDEAEKELGMALAEDPNHPVVHCMLALCLANRDKLDEATERAQAAIGLAPEFPFAHSNLARIWLIRNHLDKAEASANEAIRLDPDDEDNFVLLGKIQYSADRWKDALASAEHALSLDPDSIDGMNLQAEALRKLGRGGRAEQRLLEALAANPDEPETHAGLGWNYLEKGDRKNAMKHFREALRLDPEQEWARSGVVETLKAYNPVYRLFLKYIFWMQRLGTRSQWGVILGAWFGYMIIRRVAAANPILGKILLPVIVAYIVFVLITWFAVPLANLALRLHPFGKLALSRDERLGSNWIGGCLLAAAVAGLACLIWPSNGTRQLALSLVLMLLPLVATFSTPAPWPRWGMIIYSILLAMAAVPMIIVEFSGGYPGPGVVKSLVKNLGYLVAGLTELAFFIGIFFSLWIGNILGSIRWKK